VELTKDDFEFVQRSGLVDEGLLEMLSPTNLKKITAMVKFYEGSLKNSPVVGDAHIHVPGASANVTSDSRTRSFAKWQRLCGSDTDCLKEYLQLFLRRDAFIKEDKVRAFLAAI